MCKQGSRIRKPVNRATLSFEDKSNLDLLIIIGGLSRYQKVTALRILGYENDVVEGILSGILVHDSSGDVGFTKTGKEKAARVAYLYGLFTGLRDLGNHTHNPEGVHECMRPGYLDALDVDTVHEIGYHPGECYPDRGGERFDLTSAKTEAA